MTTQTIMQRAASLLDVTVDFSTDNQTRTRFLSCAGYILNELTEQYVDLKEEETFCPQEGKVLFSSFTKTPMKILSVTRQGKKIPFSVFSTFVRVGGDKAVTIVYTICIKNPSLTTNIVLPPCYNEDVLGLGVASEYLLRTGYNSEAELFLNRYVTALKNLATPKKNIILPARRYV